MRYNEIINEWSQVTKFWIDPEGKTHHVESGDHQNWLEKNTDLKWNSVFNNGWVRGSVQPSKNEVMVAFDPKRISDKALRSSNQMVKDMGMGSVVFDELLLSMPKNSFRMSIKDFNQYTRDTLKGRRENVSEAPIADFQVYGDRENEGSFAASDVKAFNNPKWLQKVHSHFSRTPYDFNIYLVNLKDGMFYPYEKLDGSPNTETGSKNLQAFFKGRVLKQERAKLMDFLGADIPRSRTAINIIMTDNEGDEKVGLTPWILAHRVVHAMIQPSTGVLQKPIDLDDSYAIRSLMSELFSFINKVNDIAPPNVAYKFKSAQQENIVRPGELVVELITQYIVQGSITLNIPRVDSVDTTLKFEVKNKAYSELKDILSIAVERTRTTPNSTWTTRAAILEELAERLSMTYEEAKSQFINDDFLNAYFEASDLSQYIRSLKQVYASMKDINDRVDSFLSEQVGRTFILGAPR